MTEWTLLDHLTNALKRPRVGDPKAPTLWPTEATVVLEQDGEEVVVGKCRRARALRYIRDLYEYNPEENPQWKELYEHIVKYDTEPSNYMRWIWVIGQMFEDYVINKAKESGVFIREQTPIYIRELNVSGKMDLTVVDPNDAKLRVCEIKSIYGRGANMVLGTDAKKPKEAPVPKEGNLLQLGIYDAWWVLPRQEEYARSRLIYGARDDGRYGEVEVWIEEHDEEHWIMYRYILPSTLPKSMREPVRTPFSIENIMANYAETLRHVEEGTLPKRDFKLNYDEDDIRKLYEAGKLNRADTKAWETREKHREEGKKLTVLPSVAKKGDWQCRYCDRKYACWKQNEPLVPNPTPGDDA